MRSDISTEGREPETFLRQARRRQFVEAAVGVIAEKGYDGATIAEIARRAGVAKSVVLYHFPSREKLMEAVVTEIYADATPPMLALRAQTTTERERVHAYVRGAVEWVSTWVRERPDWARAAREVAGNLRNPDGSARSNAADSGPLVASLRDLLAAGQRSGEFGTFDTWTLAVTIRSTIEALAEHFSLDPGLDGRKVADHLVMIVDRALGAPAAARDD